VKLSLWQSRNNWSGCVILTCYYSQSRNVINPNSPEAMDSYFYSRDQKLQFANGIQCFG
jgi:hypothetical protein